MNEMKLISLAFVAATIIIAFLLIIALLLIKKRNRKAKKPLEFTETTEKGKECR